MPKFVLFSKDNLPIKLLKTRFVTIDNKWRQASGFDLLHPNKLRHRF